MGNIVAKESKAALLAGWRNDQLHPNVVEALKVLADANSVLAARKASINGQYLQSLDGLDSDSAKQADAVRKLMR
jgi:hypothetical protein